MNAKLKVIVWVPIGLVEELLFVIWSFRKKFQSFFFYFLIYIRPKSIDIYWTLEPTRWKKFGGMMEKRYLGDVDRLL